MIDNYISTDVQSMQNIAKNVNAVLCHYLSCDQHVNLGNWTSHDEKVLILLTGRPKSFLFYVHVSVCHEKSSLPGSWNPPAGTKSVCLKNHHFLNRSVTDDKWKSRSGPIPVECRGHEARRWEHPKMYPLELYPGPTIQSRSAACRTKSEKNQQCQEEYQKCSVASVAENNFQG